jgi:hypothetical protein
VCVRETVRLDLLFDRRRFFSNLAQRTDDSPAYRRGRRNRPCQSPGCLQCFFENLPMDPETARSPALDIAELKRRPPEGNFAFPIHGHTVDPDPVVDDRPLCHFNWLGTSYREPEPRWRGSTQISGLGKEMEGLFPGKTQQQCFVDLKSHNCLPRRIQDACANRGSTRNTGVAT